MTSKEDKNIEDHQNIMVALARLETKVDDIIEDNKNIKKDIYGNGRAGLRLDVDRLKQKSCAFIWLFGIILISTVGFAFDILLRLL